jgi:hypothetical protein
MVNVPCMERSHLDNVHLGSEAAIPYARRPCEQTRKALLLRKVTSAQRWWPWMTGRVDKNGPGSSVSSTFQSKHVTTIELFWRGGGCSNLFHSYPFLWWWCPVHPSPVLFSGNLTYLPGNGHLVCNIQFGFFFCTSFPRRILAWSCALPRSHFHPRKAWKS